MKEYKKPLMAVTEFKNTDSTNDGTVTVLSGIAAAGNVGDDKNWHTGITSISFASKLRS